MTKEQRDAMIDEIIDWADNCGVCSPDISCSACLPYRLSAILTKYGVYIDDVKDPTHE